MRKWYPKPTQKSFKIDLGASGPPGSHLEDINHREHFVAGLAAVATEVVPLLVNEIAATGTAQRLLSRALSQCISGSEEEVERCWLELTRLALPLAEAISGTQQFVPTNSN